MDNLDFNYYYYASLSTGVHHKGYLSEVVPDLFSVQGYELFKVVGSGVNFDQKSIWQPQVH